MMFKKKLLASAMASAMVAGAMLSGGAQAVAMSENETGQLLMGEMYVARTTDYSTTVVKVVNTSLTDAVKAKIVFRSKKHSDECKDLILHLTPGDVAYMTVRLNAAGQPEVWTDDDSIMASKDSNGVMTFASQVAGGATFPMNAARTEPSADTCAQGHIEVIAAYAVSGTVAAANITSGAPSVTIAQRMSKVSLARVFETPKATLNASPTSSITNDGAANGGANFSSRVRLMGSVVIANSNDRLMKNMVALRDGVNSRTAGVVTHLVTNTTYDQTPFVESRIGLEMGLGATEMVGDIEGALTTNHLYNLFAVNGTNYEVTFPTKYRHMVTGRYSGAGATYEAPFRTAGEVAYGVTTFDNQENSAPGVASGICISSPCPVSAPGGNYLIHEVNFEALGAGWNLNGSDSGWFNMALTNQTGLDSYGHTWVAGEGAPTVGYAHFYKTGLTQSVVSTMGR